MNGVIRLAVLIAFPAICLADMSSKCRGNQDAIKGYVTKYEEGWMVVSGEDLKACEVSVTNEGGDVMKVLNLTGDEKGKKMCDSVFDVFKYREVADFNYCSVSSGWVRLVSLTRYVDE